MPKRVEVPNKTTQLPIVNKRGKKYGHKAELFMLAIEDFSSNIVNVGQPMVGNILWVNIGYYPVDECHPQT